jgi:hypothetical protein
MALIYDPVTIAATAPTGGMERDTRWIAAEPLGAGHQTAESILLLRRNNIPRTAATAKVRPYPWSIVGRSGTEVACGKRVEGPADAAVPAVNAGQARSQGAGIGAGQLPGAGLDRSTGPRLDRDNCAGA